MDLYTEKKYSFAFIMIVIFSLFWANPLCFISYAFGYTKYTVIIGCSIALGILSEFPFLLWFYKWKSELSRKV